MQSSNNEDAEKGYISIEGGTFNITAGGDGLQAETMLGINGGDITITSGAGSIDRVTNSDHWGMRNIPSNNSAAISAKGIKSGVGLAITNGNFRIDSSDDSLHSNSSLTISGGTFTLASGDDGIHSDNSLEIFGGEISITECYEGLESEAITIHDGTIHIVSSDDGINAVSASEGSLLGVVPGQNDFNVSGGNTLTIHGGYIVSDAGGDGFDINGSITMTSGIVIINGPTSNNNGALDYLDEFNITGGLLVAVGSSGMAQAPSTTSSQYSVIVNFPSILSAGTIVHLEKENGEELLTLMPKKAYQSVVVSSPELENGSTYLVYTGGNSSGMMADGLYTGGTYEAGTQMMSFTISSIVTGAGTYRGGFFGGTGGRGQPGGHRP